MRPKQAVRNRAADPHQIHKQSTAAADLQTPGCQAQTGLRQCKQSKQLLAAAGMFQCCITEGASAGFGQAVAPGGCILNFAACYTCHGREKIRRCSQFATPKGRLLGVIILLQQKFMPGFMYGISNGSLLMLWSQLGGRQLWLPGSCRLQNKREVNVNEPTCTQPGRS